MTIATKLVDISSSFAIVLAALYLEKYLLTILCLVAFRIVMPIAALAAIFLVAFWENEHIRSILTKTALKLVLVAFAMALAIPTSIYVSNLIEETYNASTQTVSSETTSSGDEIQDSAFDDATDSSQQDGSTQTTESDEEQSGVISSLSKLRNDILNGASQFASDAADTVSSGAQDVVNDAKGYLNKVIEQFVIMIIVNCVIPILVIFFYIWLINLILGTSFKLNKNPLDKATGGIKNAIRERKTSAE